MPILEKVARPSHARHWTDSIPLEYHYTAGVAGEEFRRQLRDSGKFLASSCPECKNLYLPARMFCPTCFTETKDRVTMDKPAYVYSYTIVKRQTAAENVDEPLIVALVKFEGVTGGIVHRLGGVNAAKVSFGTKVEPVLKPQSERTGALTDILYFKLAP